MRQSLPGICAIGYIDCSLLPSHLEERMMCGIAVQISETATAIPFVGTPTCITETEYDNKGLGEKTTLTFETTEKVPRRKRVAYVVKQNNGGVYIIGHQEQPFPTALITRHSGTPDSDKAVYIVEVSMIGRQTLIPSDVRIAD